MFNTLNDLKRINERNGLFFFDRATMQFWYSRVSERVYRNAYGMYIVTSEKADHYAERRYTVRYATPQGDIFTVGEFMQYRSAHQAHKAAKHYQDILVKRPKR